jgi:hypothetical protein
MLAARWRSCRISVGCLVRARGHVLQEGEIEVADRPNILFFHVDNLGFFKLTLVMQKYMTDPAGKLATPHIVNLIADPQEREPVSLPYLHSWTATHFNRLLAAHQASLKRETPIPAGAPLDFVPAPPL